MKITLVWGVDAWLLVTECIIVLIVDPNQDSGHILESPQGITAIRVFGRPISDHCNTDKIQKHISPGLVFDNQSRSQVVV